MREPNSLSAPEVTACPSPRPTDRPKCRAAGWRAAATHPDQPVERRSGQGDERRLLTLPGLTAVAALALSCPAAAVPAPTLPQAAATPNVGPLATGAPPGPGQARIVILDKASGQPMPARIHLKDSAGQTVQPPALPFWYDHFVCEGSVLLSLPAGGYTYAIERGPEFTAVQGTLSINLTSGTHLSVTLNRLADLAKEGWWSGETHVHRGLHEAQLLMRAEDLHVAQFTTWWNKANPWTQTSLPKVMPVRFDANRFYHPLAGEDERDGGALLYFNLDRPIDITSGTKHYPSSVVFARRAQQRPGAWLDIEKPFWWDFPMWVAHGIGDSVGIAHNHMNRGGVLDNEAWGKPRDRQRFPAPQGNGSWTQEIYYHLLNCGVRMPPSAGSASGVLPNPVGYNRVYVYVDDDLTWTKWWDGLRAGRCFVGNGPLLRLRANGQLPGHIFQSPDPISVEISGRLDSRDPIAAVELVRDGRVERVSLPHSLRLEKSGWFLVRAIADVAPTFRFASTGPWYVEIGGQPLPVWRESAQFFLDWTSERIAALEQSSGLTESTRPEVLAPWREAERFWQDKVAHAAAPSGQD